MSLYMETTKIAATKTAGEIMELLAKAGATKILQDFEAGKVRGLAFVMELNGSQAPFQLPVNVEPVFNLLQRRRSVRFRTRNSVKDLEQAERVAWRQVLRWIQAQVALIDTGMVQTVEVFLPYLRTPDGSTLYHSLRDNNFKQLPLLSGES